MATILTTPTCRHNSGRDNHHLICRHNLQLNLLHSKLRCSSTPYLPLLLSLKYQSLHGLPLLSASTIPSLRHPQLLRYTRPTSQAAAFNRMLRRSNRKISVRSPFRFAGQTVRRWTSRLLLLPRRTMMPSRQRRKTGPQLSSPGDLDPFAWRQKRPTRSD